MVKTITRYLLLALYLTLYSCAATKTSDFRLVSEKKSISKANDSDILVLREYYAAKSYRSKSPQYSELDSLALALGRVKGRNYSTYYVNFFSSRHNSKVDGMFFNANDSISIVGKRLNLVNYIFKNGFFREKQVIKNGKILKPKYDDVQIKFGEAPNIKIYN